MNRLLLSLIAIAYCFSLGCRQTAKEPSQSPHPTVTALKLPDIGDPDENERKTIEGVQVIGSALTDDHVGAICELTEEFKPKNSDQSLIRGVIHTGRNTADHVWQERHYQAYQKLELRDGQWHILETGAGFGTFSAPQESGPVPGV